MLFGPREPKRYAVFLSGSGSTLQSILEIQGLHQPAIVISSNNNAYGLIRAKRFGIPTFSYSGKMNIPEVISLLKKYQIDFIFLAGFMKIIKAEFLENNWKNKVFNVHPSLLPEYKGLDAVNRSWNDNSLMGVTIHDVVPEIDAGRIRLQKISVAKPSSFNLNEATLMLRSTEQSVLRAFFEGLIK